MNFFTAKNIITAGGILLSIALPRLFLNDEYEEYIIEPIGDEEIEETEEVYEEEQP